MEVNNAGQAAELAESPAPMLRNRSRSVYTSRMRARNVTSRINDR